MRRFIAVLAFFLLAGSVMAGQPFGNLPADGADVQGLALNLNFNAPTEFVSVPGQGMKLLPNAGFSLSWGWEDVWVTPNGNEYQTEIQEGLGLCFQGNYGQTVNNNDVTNAVLGLQATYQGISGVVGYQVLGDPLGGLGSSGLVLGASYSMDSIVPFTGVFIKTSKP